MANTPELSTLYPEVKLANLVSHPNFTKHQPLEFRPQPRLLYRCPYWLINITDLVDPDTPHPNVVETDADFQQILSG